MKTDLMNHLLEVFPVQGGDYIRERFSFFGSEQTFVFDYTRGERATVMWHVRDVILSPERKEDFFYYSNILEEMVASAPEYNFLDL